jgi:hypothetical protein
LSAGKKQSKSPVYQLERTQIIYVTVGLSSQLQKKFDVVHANNLEDVLGVGLLIMFPTKFHSLCSSYVNISEAQRDRHGHDTNQMGSV